MKSLSNQLIGKKSTKQASMLSAWMEEIDELNDIDALKASTLKIAKTIDEETLNTQQKLDFILAIESLNELRLETLPKQFSNQKNLKPALENSISETCYAYNRQSYIYHLKIFETVINPNKFQADDQIRILTIARTLNAAFNMSKWRTLTQQTPPTKVWLQIHAIYKIAHKQKLLNSPIVLFPLSPPTSLSAFIVQVVMLGQLSQANMHKQHIEIAAKLLKTWLTHARISDKFTAEQYVFYVDLARDSPAKRMRKMVPNTNCRFWELNDLEKQINIALTVSDRGEMPESLIISKIENLKKLNETLTILQAEWRKKDYIRQRRKEDREATSKTARVNTGIDNICNQILQAKQIEKGVRLPKNGKTLDELLRGHTVLKQASDLTLNRASLDTWVITDQSKVGLGARVNKYANIAARREKMIGIVIDGEPENVSIGVIKGVKPTQGNQLKVGVEIISRKAVWVQLQQTEGKNLHLHYQLALHLMMYIPIKTLIQVCFLAFIYLKKMALLKMHLYSCQR